MNGVQARTGSIWAPLSIFAHEVGHHYSGDATFFRPFEHSWTRELRADYISGYFLAKRGASLRNSQAAMLAMFDYYGSPTHPDSPLRMAAIEHGWRVGQSGN